METQTNGLTDWLEAFEAHEEGESCPLRASHCPLCTESALDAGIPLAVIQGKRSLTREDAIAAGMFEHTEEYRQELIDAGRAHLIKR